MTKERKDMIHRTTRILKLVVLMAAVGALVPTFLTYFAKTKTVTKINHRMQLGFSQEEVERKQSRLEWAQTQAKFKIKENPPTDFEEQVIKRAENDLIKSQNRHEERVKKYEAQYNEKSEL